MKQKDNPQNGRKYCKQSNQQGINLYNIQTAHSAQYIHLKKNTIKK